jgi:hypothetical protein
MFGEDEVLKTASKVSSVTVGRDASCTNLIPKNHLRVFPYSAPSALL